MSRNIWPWWYLQSLICTKTLKLSFWILSTKLSNKEKRIMYTKSSFSIINHSLNIRSQLILSILHTTNLALRLKLFETVIEIISVMCSLALRLNLVETFINIISSIISLVLISPIISFSATLNEETGFFSLQVITEINKMQSYH